MSNSKQGHSSTEQPWSDINRLTCFSHSYAYSIEEGAGTQLGEKRYMHEVAKVRKKVVGGKIELGGKR